MPAYLTLAQFRARVNPGLLKGIADSDIMQAITDASAQADNLLSAAGHTLPLATVGDSLRNDVAPVAVWNLIAKLRGFNPENDGALRVCYEDAIANLKRGYYADCVDATAEIDESEAYVVSGSAKPAWR